MKQITFLLALSAIVAVPSADLRAQAQTSSLSAERTVEFRTGRAVDLPVKVGQVTFKTVEMSDLGRGAARGGAGGFAGRIRAATVTSEASTTLRLRFLAENPTAEEWDVAITLEFRDRAGKVIEKITRTPSWEGEAKPYDFDLEILEYVVPMIAQVKITMAAKLG